MTLRNKQNSPVNQLPYVDYFSTGPATGGQASQTFSMFRHISQLIC